MSAIESQEQQRRIITAFAAVIFGVLFIAIVSILTTPAELEAGKIHISDVLFDRGNDLYPMTIQNMMWILFFVGLGELWIRLSRAGREASQLKLNILPEGEGVMLRAKELVPIYTAIKERSTSKDFFVQRLANRVILQFMGTQSIDQANSLMNSSMELMQHEIDMKFNMLRYLVWLIPTLGFIGTVIGIALALSDAAGMPDVSDTEEIRQWLAGLTTKLGIAFNTTLVALMMSALLVFILHIAQGREEMALNSAGQYCIDNLINRLYEDHT